MTWTPIDRFAIHLEMAREMKAPPKPNRAAKASSPPRLPPLACQVAIDTQDLGDDRQDDQDGEVGREKQHDAFHGGGTSSS